MKKIPNRKIDSQNAQFSFYKNAACLTSQNIVLSVQDFLTSQKKSGYFSLGKTLDKLT